MTREIVASALMTVALFGTPSLAATKAKSPGTVTYNRESSNPNIGWHTRNGVSVCTQDCDNPEIPGSGYTCKNVTFMGMPMRECSASFW